ncbi:MAG TPA: DUF11 domain-containing protein [Methanosarcinaceae archaeon]|nr:DUF11 domain-containing protein [Methanosarcinaceae archaeon]
MSSRNTSSAIFIITSTIIIMSIVCIVPATAAHDFQDENIWVYQGSFEIGVGERADTGDHVIKIHNIDMNGTPASATLLIYKNKVYMESFFVDPLANSEHIYDELLFIKVLDIKDGKVSLEMYKQELERVWIIDIEKIKLVSGDEITSRDYTIRISGFSEDVVAIAVSKNGTVIQDIYQTKSSKKYNDEFIVHAFYLDKPKEEIFLETYRPGTPEIEASMTSEQDIYNPNVPIEYEFIVKNNGTVPLRGIVLETSVTGGTVEQPIQKYHIINPSLSKTFKVTVIPPKAPLGTSFTVTADVKGYDYKGVEYTNSATIDTSVSSYIAIEKHVDSYQLFLNKLTYGAQETTRVNLTIHNMADFSTSVNVYDELPVSFMPVDVESLEWTLVLDSDSSVDISYKAMPTQIGSFTLPPANVEWTMNGQTYVAGTEDPKPSINVHGADITVVKSLSSNVLYEGDETTVMLTLTNMGDLDAEVSFSDMVFKWAKVISGETKWNGRVAAGESKRLEYTILPTRTGNYYMSGVEIFFADKYDNRGSIVSNSVNIYVDGLPLTDLQISQTSATSTTQQPSSTSTTQAAQGSDLSRWGAAEFMISSFITLLCIVAIVPLTAYLWLRGV